MRGTAHAPVAARLSPAGLLYSLSSPSCTPGFPAHNLGERDREEGVHGGTNREGRL